jgi:hypothetical protein
MMTVASNRLVFLLPALISLTILGCSPMLAKAAPPDSESEDALLVEAEQFTDLGGWELDQQSMDVMGSPYLLAHGLGVPVPDASTQVEFPSTGTYYVWVRTRDWCAPWNVPESPGQFQLLVNQVAVNEAFGTKGAQWHWHYGGSVTLDDRMVELRLHDLTGFEGRCDAIFFSKNPADQPPNDDPEMTDFRRKQLGLQGEPDDGGEFDLVVVGGGVAGCAAAVSAARQGLQVALIQDRPVLGGNSSSEVRVWPEGHTRQRPFPRVGEIVEELCPTRSFQGNANAKFKDLYEDDRKLKVVRAEKNITLLLEHRVNQVETDGDTIRSVVAQSTRSARRVKIRGRLFSDCTGDGTVGYLAGADFMISDEGFMGASNLWNVLDQADQKQVLECECKDKDALTVQTESGDVAAPFPRLKWAIDLSDKPFPGRPKFNADTKMAGLNHLGGWFWESGFDKDPIRDIERIRDLNMRAMYGAWDALKNTDGLYPNHRLGWSAFIAGKRESRRLIGDVILRADDFRENVVYPDPAFPNTWHIDMHHPHTKFSEGFKGDEFISDYTRGEGYTYQGPYWAPYRCLYSRNLTNLFMAGRNISVEREALGPVRVMRTCGMMGEIVGKAAWICRSRNCSPRQVYELYLSELQDLMREPAVKRRTTINDPLEVPAGLAVAEVAMLGINPGTLPGQIVDDNEAQLTGKWSGNGSLTGFLADGYLYSSDPRASARFPFSISRAGWYDVRINWGPHPNRASRVRVTIDSLDGPTTVIIDQRVPPRGDSNFQSLGKFRFDPSRNFSVTFDVADAGGNVHIDAVQLLPVD